MIEILLIVGSVMLVSLFAILAVIAGIEFVAQRDQKRRMFGA
jgi:hypothetical protein